MKNKYKFTPDLETFLITLDTNQFIEWLKTNEIEYENENLLEVMIAYDKIDTEKNV
jgi:hypothetical protein